MKKTLLAACCSLLSLSAMAVEPLAHGWYADLNFGYGVIGENLDPSKAFNYDNYTFYSAPLSGNVNGGYQFNRYFALEAGGAWFQRYSNSHFLAKDNYAIDIAAKGILPITHGLSIYGKLGGALEHSFLVETSPLFAYSTDAHRIVPMAGAGIAYNITPHFGVNIQTEDFFGYRSSPLLMSYTGGISYIF